MFTLAAVEVRMPQYYSGSRHILTDVLAVSTGPQSHAILPLGKVSAVLPVLRPLLNLVCHHRRLLLLLLLPLLDRVRCVLRLGIRVLNRRRCLWPRQRIQRRRHPPQPVHLHV